MGFFGASSAREELQERINTLDGYIARGKEERADLLKQIKSGDDDIVAMTKLRDEYKDILKPAPDSMEALRKQGVWVVGG
jgi:hypothetical protein